MGSPLLGFVSFFHCLDPLSPTFTASGSLLDVSASFPSPSLGTVPHLVFQPQSTPEKLLSRTVCALSAHPFTWLGHLQISCSHYPKTLKRPSAAISLRTGKACSPEAFTCSPLPPHRSHVPINWIWLSPKASRRWGLLGALHQGPGSLPCHPRT